MAKNEISEILGSLSSQIRGAARAWKDEAARSWSSRSASDREMRHLAGVDAKSICEVAALVKSGQVTAAYEKANGMDTVVREAIPEEFWNFAEMVRRVSSKG
jgi:hypothetical protein